MDSKKIKKTLPSILIMLTIILLWPHPVLYPLKILIVFFHEASHAFMTVITGGEVITLVVNPRQGGHVLSQGGIRFLILSAGYLGSLLWGSLIYLLAVRSRFDKHIMFILGLIIILISAFYVRDFFALSFSLITSIAMMACGLKLNKNINDSILKIIGLTSMIYVPLDIYSDTIARSGLKSDAFMLAEEYGGFTMMWGGIWLLVSGVLLFVTIKKSLKS
ncbi:hypothetical protein BVY03_01650 [bacterium K02(2017)]|nr:hypothetical protein BVY03_01650 [bacterium K02(2017)]